MVVIAFLTDPPVLKRILDHLKMPSSPPPLASARSPLDEVEKRGGDASKRMSACCSGSATGQDLVDDLDLMLYHGPEPRHVLVPLVHVVPEAGVTVEISAPSTGSPSSSRTVPRTREYRVVSKDAGSASGGIRSW